jgi:hypothetical protein
LIVQRHCANLSSGIPDGTSCQSRDDRTASGRQDAVAEGMTQTHQVAILIPLAVGAIAVLCTIFIHALAVDATVNFIRREKRLGREGAGLWINLAIVVLAISFVFVAHLIEIALWAMLFVICGEFQEFGIAYYHSAVNYTTLGYGDLIMSPSWKLLGPLEAADGTLMFGVSTAIIFAVIVRLVQAQFEDLKN